MSVLEVGPNGIPSTYRQITRVLDIKWDTVGLDTSRYRGFTFRSKDEYRYPIADNAYDIVFSGQVLEHVKKIWVWIKELARVCKKDGYVITINPVSWAYHEAPVDCWRVYPEGMKALYEDAGLEVILSVFENLENMDNSVDTLTIGKKYDLIGSNSI